MNHHFSPCRKLSWVLFVWGQIHLIPLIQQLQEGCQPERGQQNTAPICVQSWDPSGCNTRSVLNDTSRAVLTGHLLHQHYSALFVGRYPKLGAQRMPHCQALALHSGAHPTASLRNTGIKQVSYALRLFEWARVRNGAFWLLLQKKKTILIYPQTLSSSTTWHTWGHGPAASSPHC